ncbi:MAG: restriction endonuclease subunit S, partial [Methylococcales bacterium]
MGRRISPYVEETERTLTDAGLANSSARLLPRQSVILSSRAPIGHLVINTEPMAFNQGCKGLVPGNTLYYKFLYYYLSSVVDLLNALGTGATFKELSGGKLKQVEIPVPSIPEQHRIVAILDKAFDGIATAKANAEKNLQNARALFESHLNAVFNQRNNYVQVSEKAGGDAMEMRCSTTNDSSAINADIASMNNGRATKTGGRNATLRPIPGELSLAVGIPSIGARNGWTWTPLTDLARLESGHTPSRRHPEYWGGTIPWIGIQDARENHGQRITDTSQKTNELGIANSSARVLPTNTVCLSRTASVGYVVVMGRPMATSQDFVNWVCSSHLIPDFLKYLFLAEGREGLLRYASGAVHQTIYFPEAKAFHICHPETDEQIQIVRQCDEFREETQRLESIYQRKLAALDELKKSLLHQAFSGAL